MKLLILISTFLLLLQSCREHKIIYDDFGIKSEEGNLLNNKRTGRWLAYHMNGKIWYVSHYKRDSLIRKSIYYDEKGRISSKEWYDTNPLVYAFTIGYDTLGNAWKKQKFKNGHPKWIKRYYKNNKLKDYAEECCDYGMYKGKYKEWYENGSLKQVGFCDTGAYVFQYSGDSLVRHWRKKTYSYRMGNWNKYYSNNRIKASGTYYKGLLFVAKDSLQAIKLDTTDCAGGINQDHLYHMKHGIWIEYDSVSGKGVEVIYRFVKRIPT